MSKFRMRYLLLAFVPLAVAGCVSAKEQHSMDKKKCASFGYLPNTDAFADCMMKQSTRRDDDEQRYLDRMHDQEKRDRDRKKARHRKDDDIDARPSYDKDGNPNFDTKGNYQGCHGIGCQVDNPDDDDDS